jgi:Cu+-exporting ATPase
MTKLFYSIILLLVTSSLTGFQPAGQMIQKPTQKNLKHLEVKITGMTCEIGCARTIESKVSKMEGVVYSKVNYAESKGQFSYNPKKTSAKKIIAKIDGIAGGSLYKVVENKEVTSFSGI